MVFGDLWGFVVFFWGLWWSVSRGGLLWFRWFVVVYGGCGGLWWFVVVCGGL